MKWSKSSRRKAVAVRNIRTEDSKMDLIYISSIRVRTRPKNIVARRTREPNTAIVAGSSKVIVPKARL